MFSIPYRAEVLGAVGNAIREGRDPHATLDSFDAHHAVEAKLKKLADDYGVHQLSPEAVNQVEHYYIEEIDRTPHREGSQRAEDRDLFAAFKRWADSATEYNRDEDAQSLRTARAARLAQLDAAIFDDAEAEVLGERRDPLDDDPFTPVGEYIGTSSGDPLADLESPYGGEE